MTAILELPRSGLVQPSMLSGRQRRIAFWAMAAALLLHVAIIIVCIVDWAALLDLALAHADVPEAIPVTLVYEPPPPPPRPHVQPEPAPRPPIAPRVSGETEKTEAKAEDTPQPALPQPNSPPPEPASSQKKPAPVRAGSKEPASVAPASSAEAASMAETRKETPMGPLFHTIRLPSQHGGTGERDTAGDAYLNRMRDLVEKHRIYPPASAFRDGVERLAIYSILVDPTGELVQIKLEASSGSSIADEAAGNMIRSAAPFLPLPANFPHIRTVIEVELPIYPLPR